MKRLVLTVFLATLATGLCADVDEAAEAAEAKRAIAAFAGALKSELVAAMQSGGAINAIGVCNTSAPAIGEAVSLEKGVNLSRVSMKNRNPVNEAKGWQAEVLASFEARMDQGEDADKLSWHEVVESGEGQEFRFMKAIPTGGLCLQCHGQTIAPDVAEKLASLYPDDKATGYSIGDIRGAFVVTRQINP